MSKSKLCLVLFFLAGCGGGSSGSDAPVVKQITSSNIHTYKVGDWIKYGGTLAVSGQGTYSITMTESITGTTTNPVSQEQVLVEQDDLVISNSSGLQSKSTTKIYFSQDAQGAFYRHGGINSNGTEYWLNQGVPEKTMVSPISLGVTGDISYSKDTWNGSWTNVDNVHYTYSIQSKEQIGTPLASFESYRAADTTTNASGTNTGTFWLYPGIGKIKVVEDYTEGSFSGTLTASIVDTNIPY